MRFALALVMAFATTSLFAEAAAPAAGAAVSTAAINSVCPLDGAKIDAKVAPVAGKTKEGKEVQIGSCCADCAGKIKDMKGTAAADAAVANKKIEEKSDKK